MNNLITTLVEILIFFLCFYLLLRTFQGTRGAGIFKGLIIFLIFAFVGLMYLSEHFELLRVRFILEKLVPAIVLVFIIIFQPELRRLFVKLGQSPLFFSFLKTESESISEVVKAVSRLSKNRIGALIAIEREIGLGTYAEGGVTMDAKVTSELIETIFYPGTPLHDGAVIIQSGRIVAAGCLFPLTDNPDIAKSMGTRHRAGIGITEETDAITIIVSEELGTISVGMRGYLNQNADKNELERLLTELYLKPRKELTKPACPQSK